MFTINDYVLLCGLFTFKDVCLLQQDVSGGVSCVSLQGFPCVVAVVARVIAWPCCDPTDCNISILFP